MPLQPVPNTMQVDVLFSLFGQTIENVFHVNSPTGVDAAALADCADAVHLWVTMSYLPVLPDQVGYLRTEVKNLSIPAGSVVVRSPVSPVSGALAGGAEPGGTTFVAALRTGSSGRSYRGRKYVPAVPVTQRTGNSVSATWAADVIAALEDLRLVLISISQVLVIVSRIQAGLELLIPITTEVLSINYSDLYIDSQRRRLTGRGM